MKIARIYIRVSTEEQELVRQDAVIANAQAAGYYVAAVYREKASGTRADRPALLRMIEDLQPGEVVIAEKMDRISRLPLPDAEKLIASITAKKATLAIPGVTDLSELAANAEGVTKIVVEAVQTMLLKLALQMARDDYETMRNRQRQGITLAVAAGKYKGRAPDIEKAKRILELRASGYSIRKTAEFLNCSESQVKRICKLHKEGCE